MPTFIINLYDEETGNTMDIVAQYDCEPDEASDIMRGRFGRDFTAAAFERISVIPVAIDSDDDDDDYDEAD